MKLNLLKALFVSTFSLSSITNAAPSSEAVQLWLRNYNNYIVISIPIEIEKLDPTKSINAHTKFTLPLIFEPLITVNVQQELQPVLAKSWQISPDNKTIIISIKPNHFFSDGTEVTAEHVRKSILRLCNPSSQEYGELRGLLGCEDHDKVKKSTLILQ